MQRSKLIPIVWGSFGLVVAALLLKNISGLLTFVALAAAVALAVYVAFMLIQPWSAERVQYRVRYHASEEISELSSLGELFATLARYGGGVRLIWRREGGQLTLSVEAPAAVERNLLAILRTLPEMTVEPDEELLPPSGKLYKWSLAKAGSGSISDPLKFDNLFGNEVWVGDFEMRLSMALHGGVVLVCGVPAPGAKSAGVKSFWAPLWPFMSTKTRRPRKATLGFSETDLATPSGDNASEALPSSSVESASAGTVAVAPTVPAVMSQNNTPETGPQLEGKPPLWLRLFRQYPAWDPWSFSETDGQDARSDPPDALAPKMRMPLTQGQLKLDTRAGVIVPLHPDYSYPPQPFSLLLGRATLDQRPVGLPIWDSAMGCHPAWSRGFAILGDREGRDADIDRLVATCADANVGVVVLDTTGDTARRVAAKLPSSTRARRSWVDCENPAGSKRINLLHVPPLGEGTNKDAAALLSALQDVAGAFVDFLCDVGVTAPRTGGHMLLLDWTRLLLIRAHRARLGGAIAGERESVSASPDITTLYHVIRSNDDLYESIKVERTLWGAAGELPPHVAHLLNAGADGQQAVALARSVLDELSIRASDNSVRASFDQAAVGLYNVLKNALTQPTLAGMWRGPYESPIYGLAQPHGILLARVAGRDVLSSRWYLRYLIGCLRVCALQRKRLGGTRVPPLLCVLDSPDQFSAILPYLADLRDGGIAVLLTLPRIDMDALKGMGTWIIHTLAPADVPAMRSLLERLGIDQDLPLQKLPAGVVVLKTPSPHGTIITTAQPELIIVDTRAWRVSGPLQEAMIVAAKDEPGTLRTTGPLSDTLLKASDTASDESTSPSDRSGQLTESTYLLLKSDVAFAFPPSAVSDLPKVEERAS